MGSASAEGTWSLRADVEFFKDMYRLLPGLSDSAIGNLVYAKNTAETDVLRSYIQARKGFSGYIYYELNVNEGHSVFATVEPKTGASEVKFFSGGHAYTVLSNGNVTTSRQPAQDPSALISDGYFVALIQIKNGKVARRYGYVATEVDQQLSLIKRINYIFSSLDNQL